MYLLLTILSFFAAFALMELVAYLANKYLMHGFLWFLHKDHHRQPKGFFQMNDWFFVLFALPSWLSIMFGLISKINYLASFGFGIALFGFCYFLFHEVLIHQRFKPLRKLFFPKVESKYLKSVVKVPYAHHKHLDKTEGESFGLLYVPNKFKVK